MRTKVETTVAICADDLPVAERLRDFVSSESLVVTAVLTAADELDALDPVPDVVVLHAPGATRRAQIIKHLRTTLPEAQIVAVGRTAKGHEVRSSMEAGAGGFVFEEEAESTLAVTIRVACAGQIAVPRRERRQVERPTLSAREKQILGLVVMGFMNCEIADRLYLAESTIKSHLSSAFAKLGVRSRNEAVDLILDGKDGLGRGILAITGEPGGGIPSTSAAA